MANTILAHLPCDSCAARAAFPANGGCSPASQSRRIRCEARVLRGSQISGVPNPLHAVQLLSVSVWNSKALTDRDEGRLCLGILEAKMRPLVAPLNRPVDFASSCNARRLFAQVIQLLPVGPDNHTICHLELSLTQTSSSQCNAALHRRLILMNASCTCRDMADPRRGNTITRFDASHPNIYVGADCT